MKVFSGSPLRWDLQRNKFSRCSVLKNNKTRFVQIYCLFLVNMPNFKKQQLVPPEKDRALSQNVRWLCQYLSKGKQIWRRGKTGSVFWILDLLALEYYNTKYIVWKVEMASKQLIKINVVSDIMWPCWVGKRKLEDSVKKSKLIWIFQKISRWLWKVERCLE